MSRRWLAAALILVFIGAGCQVNTTVDIAVAPDGSGRVTVTALLDAAAAKRLPDLDQSLLVADLRKTGWKVVDPKAVSGGGWRVSASKPFRDTTELTSVIEEVAGKGGPFRDFKLTRTHRFAKTSYRLKGTVDLSGGINAFGDPQLREALGGLMFGRTDAQLAEELGKPPAEAFQFKVVADLPGGGKKEWIPRLGDQPTTVSASSAARKPAAWLFAFASLLAAVGFLGTLFLIARHNRMKAPPSYVHRPGGGQQRPWD